MEKFITTVLLAKGIIGLGGVALAVMEQAQASGLLTKIAALL